MITEQPLRIAVADDEPEMLLFFRELLPAFGHAVVAEAKTGRELVERCRGARPDLVITDIRMPDGDGLQAVAEVNREVGIPVIVVTGHHDTDVLSEARANYIMAYLAKPVKPVDLQAAVRLAMLRFGHFQALAKEAADLRQALEDRKIIERAKGIVMKRGGADESEAFRRLQRIASEKNKRLIEVAQQVILAEEAFHYPERR